MDRKLVTVREIQSIEPIEGKDRIELAKVDGWQSIVKKGDFEPGMFGVYFEIDSLLPLDNPAFEFLKKDARTHHRLKTMKMGGVLSQGLLLPINTEGLEKLREAIMFENHEDLDLDAILGITKYEPPQSGEPGAPRLITFPAAFPRTDLERCQNMKRALVAAIEEGELFEVSEKLDGCSLTAFAWPQADGENKIGVCSRNQEIPYVADAPGRYWQAVLDAGWPRYLSYLAEIVEGPIAFQGELMGPNIQGNRKQLDRVDVYLFDIFSVPHARYLTPGERFTLLALLHFKFGVILNHVPVFKNCAGVAPVETMLADIDHAYLTSVETGKLPIEGLVFKSTKGSRRFKVLSNEYLLKYQ